MINHLNKNKYVDQIPTEANNFLISPVYFPGGA